MVDYKFNNAHIISTGMKMSLFYRNYSHVSGYVISVVINITFLIFIFNSSCRKEEEKIMKVKIDSIADISNTTAKAYATIIDTGEGVEKHGHCWDTSSEPTVVENENKTENGPAATNGQYSSMLTGLLPDTKYYARAYVQKGDMVVYSTSVESFRTLSTGLPVVTTGTVKNITISNAIVNGSLDNLGSGVTEIIQYGHCWSSETITPVIYDNENKTSLGSRDTTGTFESLLVGLSPGTLYYVRAYATNDAGTSYGDSVSFITISENALPVVETTPASSVTQSTAQSGGNVIYEGGSVVTACGVCWSTSENPVMYDSCTTDGSGEGSFISYITGLSSNSTYYVAAYATNNVGTAYGDHLNFTTLSSGNSLPEISSVPPDSIEVDEYYSYQVTAVDADMGDVLTYSVQELPDWLQFNSSSKILSGTPALGDKGNHAVTLRVSDGTDFDEQTYTIVVYQPSGTVIDYDDNTYKTVKIGNQWWMAENLKVTHYTNGTPLEDGTGKGDVSQDDTARYWFVYDDNPAYKDTYGLLYTWSAAMNGASSSISIPSGVQGVCPAGWHMPSNHEWAELITYLNGGTVAGGKLKETGIELWLFPNTDATNESGFTALPGGGRDSDGDFTYLGSYAFIWTATESSAENGYERAVYNEDASVYQAGMFSKAYGFSIRCVKD